MGRPATHGSHQLTARLFSTSPKARINDRTRRVLRNMTTTIAADPLTAVAAFTQGRFARYELICQNDEAWILAHPGEAPPKYAQAHVNAWRRTAELLLQIEQQLATDTVATSTCSRCNFTGAGQVFLQHDCPPATPSRVASAAAGPSTTGGGPADPEEIDR